MRQTKIFPFVLVLAGLNLLPSSMAAQGWQQLWHGLPSFYAVSAVDSNVCWVAGDRTLIVRTTNGGRSWYWSENGLAGDTYTAVFARSAALAWTGSVSGKIYCTIDSGKTWTLQYTYPGPGATDFDAIYFWDDQNGIAMGDPPLYPASSRFFIARTTNGGALWTQDTTGVPVVTNQYGFNMDFAVTGNHFWFGSTNGQGLGDTTVQHIIGHSSDRGLTWETINAPPTFGNPFVAFSDSLNGIIMGFNGHIARTTNGGKNWQMRYNGIGFQAGFLKGTGTVWSGGGHLFRSNDYGTSWADQGQAANPGITGFSVVNANCVWACGFDYLVLRTNTGGGATSVQEFKNQSSSPSSFNLEQNYPNPFNPTTSIKYRVDNAQRIRLVIYDEVGREIRVLLDENQTEGWHLANWNGRNNSGEVVSTGVYFYRIEGSTETETKRMIMLK